MRVIIDEHDKFYSEGMKAILKPFPFYDPKKAKITTYLKTYIDGSMIDLIRKETREIGVSRNTARALAKVGEVEGRLGEKFNLSNPTHVKHLTDMGFSQATISNMGQVPQFICLDDIETEETKTHDNVKNESISAPYEYVVQSRFLEKLLDIINGLNEKQRQVFTLYHIEQYNQKEIADKLGASKSSISQILSTVNKKIEDQMEIDASYFNKRNRSQKARNNEPEHLQYEHSL